jgi:aldehyde oxidoreductase
MAGNAFIDAGKKLMNAMRKEDGTYRTFQEMLDETIPTKYMGVHTTNAYTKELDPNTGHGYPSAEYTYGAYAAEVEVETSTGKTRVVAMHCVADVGVIGNFLAVEGQAYGGMHHSIGFALSEDYSDYKKHVDLIRCGFPFIEAVPDGDDYTVELIETPRPTGPHGSSGCAELFQSSDHVAILNAIHDAVGVRVRDLPVTPEKLLAAIRAKEEGKADPYEPYYLGGDMYEKLEAMRNNPVAPKEG